MKIWNYVCWEIKMNSNRLRNKIPGIGYKNLPLLCVNLKNYFAMKRIITLFAFLAIVTGSYAQVTKFETAVAYNDFIVGEQTKVGETIKQFINTYSNSTDSSLIQQARKAIVKQADSAVRHVRTVVSFKGDTSLKQSAIRLFNFYSVSAANEYNQLVQLSFDTRKSAEQVNKEMAAIAKDITEREKSYDADFQEAQKAFAAKHNINLTENKFKLKDNE